MEPGGGREGSAACPAPAAESGSGRAALATRRSPRSAGSGRRTGRTHPATSNALKFPAPAERARQPNAGHAAGGLWAPTRTVGRRNAERASLTSSVSNPVQRITLRPAWASGDDGSGRARHDARARRMGRSTQLRSRPAGSGRPLAPSLKVITRRMLPAGSFSRLPRSPKARRRRSWRSGLPPPAPGLGPEARFWGAVKRNPPPVFTGGGRSFRSRLGQDQKLAVTPTNMNRPIASYSCGKVLPLPEPLDGESGGSLSRTLLIPARRVTVSRTCQVAERSR